MSTHFSSHKQSKYDEQNILVTADELSTNSVVGRDGCWEWTPFYKHD